MDYDNETRLAYRSATRADAYRRYQSTDWSWGRVATWREQHLVGRILSHRVWNESDIVLDAPCGTGILAPTLAPFSRSVLATDISLEMMRLATEAYSGDRLANFVQADITSMPFPDAHFAVVLTLGFMHRVPPRVREKALAEIHRVCAQTAIVSYSLVSPAQRIKHRVLLATKPGHVPAPCAIPMREAEAEMRRAGFNVVTRTPVLPLLSSEWLYVLTTTESP
jgi:ubiquinone/menaquinone biosynthesis C-methylase UbiE